MDYFSQQYFNTKNAVIKAERRMLKELGFCVHVKHPHKIIITYLNMLGVEKNVELTRKAWNYMNDSMRSDVFVRFPPETVACACIFLAARITKVNLPLRPPWWKLFDSNYDDIEDISLTILRLYARPRRKLSYLDATVSKLKKILLEKKEAQAGSQNHSPAGSFTPSHTSAAATTTFNLSTTTDSVKQSTKTISPDNQVKKRPITSVIGAQKNDRNEEYINDRRKNNHSTNKRHMSESDVTESSSDSEPELPSKKYAQQRRQYESEKYRSSSSDSEEERKPLPSKIHRSDSPTEYRKEKKDYDRNRIKASHKDKGAYKNNDIKSKHNRRRSRSRSPVKRIVRTPSPPRKEKYQKEKDRIKSKYKHEKEKYSEKYLEKLHKVRR